MAQFHLVSPYRPAGDQPKAIRQLTDGLKGGIKHQTLLGVTGSGKTFTMAHVVAKIARPTLVIAHNKTLAAQLAAEFRQFFPESAVEYFVSYYDYYQPEAYLPATDTYIEKEADINDEIDRLRHSATQAVLSRRDVIVVASVSCIYGLGRPETYGDHQIVLSLGTRVGREELVRRLVALQFTRNDLVLTRGTFRVHGAVFEIMPANRELIYRIELGLATARGGGEQVETITVLNPLNMDIIDRTKTLVIYPAKHFLMKEEGTARAFGAIEEELARRLEELTAEGKLLEAERLRRRTLYDLEMMREVGYCTGIENYSRHLDGRAPGEPPATLLNYFPGDFLLVLDESHVTIPQIRGMYHGDRTRKDTLVEFGFRLPSARDNRPLTFEEFTQATDQVIYVSATPAEYELKRSKQVVEQIIRPTGLVDPALSVHPSEGQITHLMDEIRKRVARDERTLVTTLTKKMAEDLTTFLIDQDLKVRYLHSDIATMERITILRDLREGRFDVLVGVNLLREGLDLPEVSLVAILDADKEGFLRSEESIIQTIGRAARHIRGAVLLYADIGTGSLTRAVAETERRRALQLAHNRRHKITPKTIKRAIATIRLEPPALALDPVEAELAKGSLETLIKDKERAMKNAAQTLQFELAALLRDELVQLRQLKRERVRSLLA